MTGWDGHASFSPPPWGRSLVSPAPLATYWASPGGCTASTGYLGPVQGTKQARHTSRHPPSRIATGRRCAPPLGSRGGSVQVRTLSQVLAGSAELAGRGGSEGGRARCPLTGGRS